MTTASFSSVPQNNDDTTFRTWAGAISTALATIGLVKTTDTGQINFTTVTNPDSSYQQRGYEIWRFSDTAQSTYPLFFKIEYGSVQQSFYPGIRLTLGKGSNGTGTITSIILGPIDIGFPSANSTRSGYASSSGSGMSVYLAPGSVTAGFTIERSLNSSGAATGEAVMVSYGGQDGQIGTFWQVYKYSNPSVYCLGISPVLLPTVYSGGGLNQFATLSPDATTGLVIPIPIMCSTVTPWISKQLVAIAPGDVGASTLFTASAYGASHTYRGFATTGASPCPIGTASGYTPAAIWWE